MEIYGQYGFVLGVLLVAHTGYCSLLDIRQVVYAVYNLGTL